MSAFSMTSSSSTRIFMVAGDVHFGQERPETFISMSEDNTADLLRWLGFEDADPAFGALEASDLMARCRRRLWPMARNNDPAIPAQPASGGGHLTVVSEGREAGYLRARTEEMLKLAERAGPGGHVLYS